ncbi:MAG: hypothetical protein U0Z26_17405 [Anaerolineales bacterium]
MNDSTEQNSSRGPSIVRWILILFGLVLFALILFMGGKFLYSFGQRTAENIAGVDKTLTSKPTDTETPIPPTSTITITPGPSPTSTFFYTIPTATATRIPWTTCPGIVVTINDTDKGDLIHILRCSDKFEYDLGPITKGAFAVSPDDRYLVYASEEGILYAAKIGETALYTMMNLKRDGDFVTFPRNAAPIFKLKFEGTGPYVLVVYEARYDQKLPVQMPNWLSK